MKKRKLIACILSTIISLGLLCSCDVTVGRHGWKLLGFIKTDPVPPSWNDLNGTYVLHHIVTETLQDGNNTVKNYEIGDYYYGMTLSSDMIVAEINNGTGFMSYSFDQETASTNITCTIEDSLLIMNCETPVDLYLNGNLQNQLTLSIVQNEETYLVLQASNGYHNFYYYVIKSSS